MYLFALRVRPDFFFPALSLLPGQTPMLSSSTYRFVQDEAQIEVEFSHRVMEMLFLRLKHHFLFTIPLTNIAALTKGVDLYLTESNLCMPHSPLMGATPEEAITGKWTQEKMMAMKEKVLAARLARTQSNISRRCESCLG